AYRDIAFPIGDGQTISQPYTVAYQSELLHVKKGDRIVEIGTGPGYQTCTLMELGAEVYTIERQESLYNRTIQVLPYMGYKPHFFWVTVQKVFLNMRLMIKLSSRQGRRLFRN